MNSFHSAREAKEFLVSRILDEASRENLSVSEVERKMLYFSETDWTLPDIGDVSDQFDREYDQDEYEAKITGLVRRAANHDRRESHEQYDRWWAAIRVLEKGDHYILVMIRAASLRPRGDQLRLLGAGILLAAALVLFEFAKEFLSNKYGIDFGKHGAGRDAPFIYLWFAAVSVVVGYWVVRFLVGAKKADDLTSDLLEKLVRVFKRSGSSARE